MSNQRGWRLDGEVLVVDKGATLPNLCLYDGTVVPGAPIQKTLTWIPPWVSILAISPIIFLIVYLIVRKTGALGYYLSEEAKKRRNTGLFLALGSIVVLFGAMFGAGVVEEPMLILVGFVLFFVLLIVGLLRTRIFVIKRIDETSLQLKLRPEAARAFAGQVR